MKIFFILIQLILLAAGYGVFFNQWVKPSSFPVFNILPLFFLIVFILNIFLLIFWWIYDRQFALLFTFLSLGLILPLKNHIHIYGKPETQKSNLKVLSYNVRYFFDDADGIISFLQDQEADIILFQEMGPQPEWVINNASKTKKYYFEEFSSLGIASKFPVIEAQMFRIKPYPLTYAYADIALPNDTIRVINFYLESLHLDQNAIKNTEIESQIPGKSKYLLKKIITASTVHEKQVKEVRKIIKNSPYPVIVAGDMNAVPNSFEYFTLKRGLKDVFHTGGEGIATTFPGFKYPLRLDYIFVSERFKVKSHQIFKVQHSDHYPVVAELELE
ncbi:MAG: endonuclease/exonuclease/phosphatase family protein [Flavobacteriaceae bacterium]|nr:endonuclease/exonuclease/phosphatase family protein [Flavobacteriaceae bacterium]